MKARLSEAGRGGSAAAGRHEPSWSGKGNPFKFLDFFTEADEAGFAGRERDVREALAGVLRAPSFVLYGGSGTGKTSLVLAGLFPELRRQGLRPLYVRTLSDPTDDLLRALRHELKETAPPEDAELPELVAALGTQSPVVLVFDQFEEFFIRFRDESHRRDRFIEALGSIAADVKLLFSLRQEYLAELDDFRRHLPQLFDNEYRLKPLTAFGARQAIVSQVQRAGVPFERRFLTRLVDLLKDDNFDPTILQVVCSEVYRQAVMRSGSESPQLTAADVDAVGDLRLLFRRYLDEMAAALSREVQLTMRTVLAALIAGERTRRAADFDTLCRESAGGDRQAVERVLAALAVYRLVRTNQQGDESWYELTHERMVPVVREWLELDERFRELRTARQLIASMVLGDAWRRHPELLLTAYQVENVIAPVQEHLGLDDTEVEFLLRSAIYRRSRDPAIHWAGRFGTERSRRLMLELFSDRDPAVVLGAARMARHVEDSAGALARACARLAAVAEDDEIAAEAFYSLLRFTRGGEHRRLMREAAVAKVWRRGPLGLVQRCHRFVRFQRLVTATRRQAARQAMAEPYRNLKTRLLDSLAAGLIWSFLIGPAIYLLAVWPTGVPELIAIDTLVQAVGYGAPVVSLIAIVLAGRLPAAVARAVGRIRPSWPRIVFFSWALPLDLGAIVLIGVVVYGVGTTGDLSLLGLLLALGIVASVAWLVLASVLLLVTVLVVSLSGAAIRPDDPERRIWGWSLITSCGLPILLPVVVFCGPGYLLSHAFPESWAFGFGMILAVGLALPVSFLCFVFHVLLARSGLWPAAAPTADRRRRRARVVAVSALAVNLIGWLLAVGPDTVPLLAAGVDVRESPVLTGHLGPGFPDADYLRIHSRSPVLLRVKPENLELLKKGTWSARIEELDLNGAIRSPDHLLALPGDRLVTSGGLAGPRSLSRPFAVTVSNGQAPSLWQPWTLSFEVLHALDPTASRPVHLSEKEEEWKYWLTTLEWETDVGWRVALDGELELPAQPPANAQVEVVVFRNQPSDATDEFEGKVVVEVESAARGWESSQDPQNCSFSSRPFFNHAPEIEPRRTWRIPICHGRLLPARIKLDELPAEDYLSPVLIAGARIVEADEGFSCPEAPLEEALPDAAAEVVGEEPVPPGPAGDG